MRERKPFIIYKVDGGRIVAVGKTTSIGTVAHGPDEAVLTGYALEPDEAWEFYVGAGGSQSFLRRPRLPALPETIGVAGHIRLAWVPKGARVFIDDEFMGETDADESMEIKFDTDGSFNIRLDMPWPWIDAKQTVKVTP